MQVKATERNHEHLPFGAQGAASAYQLRDHIELVAQWLYRLRESTQIFPYAKG